jgi:putative acetyltransferase
MENGNLTIRYGNLEDLSELQKLFVETISTVCVKDYNEEQIRVWTSSIENKQRWIDILTKQYSIIAVENNRIVGFCTLDNGNYIDLIYVHKDCQRKGVANLLYAEIEKEAIRQGMNSIHADVSKTAKSFFEKKVFIVITEQTINLKGVEINNFKMTKELIHKT